MVTKANNFKRSIKTFRLALIILITLTSAGLSQVNNPEEYDLPENEVVNYLYGMKSDNPGLKASSIYFVGKYKIIEACENLIEEINNSDDEESNLLVAWSLYRIGDECCLKELEKIAKNHTSEKLKTFCSNLYQLKKIELAFLNEHSNRKDKNE